ncbi:MAG: class I SAM-dependent methyltransferase [Promethearchaeia archaeon]
MSVKLILFLKNLYKKLDLGLEDFKEFLDNQLKDCNSILDLGCGRGSILALIKRGIYTVGVDIYQEYIDLSKKQGIHDDYFCYDILKIDEIIEPKSFDCILLLDVIEHLNFKDGLKLLLKMEKIAKKKIIITTPNGFLPQKEYHGNPYQIHKSGWNTFIFKRLGFKVYGYFGLKFIRGERGKIKLKPINFWRLISDLSNKFIKYLPYFSFKLCCIKEFK